MGRTIIKCLLWVVASVLLLLTALILLLYSPWFQRLAADKVSELLNDPPRRQVTVESFSLSFPLAVEVKGFSMTQWGDTVMGADLAALNVRLLPLLAMRVEAVDTRIENAVYQLGAPDSAMYLRADGLNAAVNRLSVSLLSSKIDVDEASVDGGRLKLMLSNDTTSTPPDTTPSTPWHINARSIRINNLDYSMTMLPVIDSLHAAVSAAELIDGVVDLASQSITAGGLVIDGVDALYLTPSAEYLKTHPAAVPAVADTDTLPSRPWVVTADSLRLRNSRAIYVMAGAVPRKGLDFDYLQVTDVNIAVDSFYNRATDIVVPLRNLSAKERSGLRLKASGVFSMDSLMMRAKGFDIATQFSALKLDAYMGMGDLASDPSLPVGVKAKGRIGFNDMQLAFPAMAPVLKQMPRYDDLLLAVDAAGSIGRLKLSELSADLPGHAAVSLSGEFSDVMDFNNMTGHLDIDGDIADVNFLKPTLLDARTARQVALPPLSLDGGVDFNRGTYSGDIKAVTGGGDIALNGMWNGNSESYDADLNLNSFPVNSFLPEMGLGRVSGHLVVNGKGYDPFSPATSIKSEVDIASIAYNDETYTDLKAWANLADGKADVGVMSFNPAVDFDISGNGNLAGDRLDWNFSGDVKHIDLQAMKLSKAQAEGAMSFSATASLTPDMKNIDASIVVDELEWRMPGVDIDETDIMARLHTTDSLLSLVLDNHDLHADFNSPMSLDSVMARFAATGGIVDKVLADRRLDVIALQQTLPPLSLDVKAGRTNIINSYLAGSDIGFNTLDFSLSNDTLINADGRLTGFHSGTTRIDTLDLTLAQRGKYLRYTAEINNAPGTMDEWAHVNVSGYLADETLALLLKQRNIKDETGFKLGAVASVTDSTINLKLAPYNPVIGYKKWTVNSDNFLTVNTYSKHLDADISMSGNGSSVRLYTEHDPLSSGQEDVVVKVSNVHLADWISLNPFAPPVTGDVSADMRFGWDKKSLNGQGTVTLDDLTYDRQRVGSFEVGVDLTTDKSGTVRASASLMVDSVKTITAVGNLNDSTAANPFMLDFSMIHFPLSVVNPFLPAGTARLSGMLNGRMDITGDLANPVFNGFLEFDSTAVKVNMIGTTFRFSDDSVPVRDNIVTFERFAIKGVNDNPLIINGSVDMRSLVNPKINLGLQARDMQIVGSDRARGADAYGKAFINLDAKIKGDMSLLNIDAELDVLAGTNVTYIMTEAQSALSSRSNDDMVKFVNFADTAAVAQADTIPEGGMMMNIDAVLNVDPGSTLTVDLSADGKNRVQVQGSGTLNYTQNYMNDSRFTGRYTIDKGYARITPPIPGMSEKRFDFESGSYVAFNGDMLNPILNVNAVDKIKANVTQEGHNSRLVTFDVGLSVTNTLQNMDVAFDLSTDDDITVQNELQSMSPEQRANQAMNILLYGIYSGAGTKGNAQIGGNMLYSFLESRLNSWAANNIKGVDLSFGIDQYDQTTDGATSTTTSYSYKVSKSMFNDRFKIVVGGNYTTDANSDENIAQNLVNDISFEYLLNKSGTMYVRLFRHVGYESILEGEVTQTGVGFVYKRKIRRIGDMFRWIPRRKKKQNSVALPELGQPLTPQTSTVDEKN